jgi:hypothetical protein
MAGMGSRARRLILRAIVSGVLGFFALGATAFAQTNSTGGVIGKTDKSQSGSDEPQSAKPTPKPKQQPSAHRNFDTSTCGKISGVWSWFNGGNTSVRSDGTMTHGSDSGTWTCKDNKIVMFWKSGWTDRLTLSSDGNHLEGTNGLSTVTGDRQ